MAKKKAKQGKTAQNRSNNCVFQVSQNLEAGKVSHTQVTWDEMTANLMLKPIPHGYTREFKANRISLDVACATGFVEAWLGDSEAKSTQPKATAVLAAPGKAAFNIPPTFRSGKEYVTLNTLSSVDAAVSIKLGSNMTYRDRKSIPGFDEWGFPLPHSGGVPKRIWDEQMGVLKDDLSSYKQEVSEYLRQSGRKYVEINQHMTSVENLVRGIEVPPPARVLSQQDLERILPDSEAIRQIVTETVEQQIKQSKISEGKVYLKPSEEVQAVLNIINTIFTSKDGSTVFRAGRDLDDLIHQSGLSLGISSSTLLETVEVMNSLRSILPRLRRPSHHLTETSLFDVSTYDKVGAPSKISTALQWVSSGPPIVPFDPPQGLGVNIEAKYDPRDSELDYLHISNQINMEGVLPDGQSLKWRGFMLAWPLELPDKKLIGSKSPEGKMGFEFEYTKRPVSSVNFPTQISPTVSNTDFSYYTWGGIRRKRRGWTSSPIDRERSSAPRRGRV